MPKKNFRRLRKKGARKGRRVPKMSFDKRVLRAIDSQRELKVATYSNSVPVLNVLTNNSGLKIMPTVPQAGNTGAGTAAAQEFYRDGNQILLKKVVIRYWISLKTPPNSLDSKAITRLMIVRQKNMDANALLQNNQFKDGQLLENAAQFVGNIPSLQTPINKAAFAKRMDKRNYISSPTINQAQLDVDGDQTNAFKMGQKTLTFGEGKRLVFGTGGEPEAINFPYFMLIGQASPTGQSVNGLEFNYTTTAYFYDS